MSTDRVTYPEPPDGSVVGWGLSATDGDIDAVICRDDKAAAEAGYGDKHWYDVGSAVYQDPPTSWEDRLWAMRDSVPFLLVRQPFTPEGDTR